MPIKIDCLLSEKDQNTESLKRMFLTFNSGLNAKTSHRDNAESHIVLFPILEGVIC